MCICATGDNTADHSSLACHPTITRATLCSAFVTSKFGTMKGVEAHEILYVTTKLWDGAIRNEMLVIYVTAELRDAMVWRQ